MLPSPFGEIVMSSAIRVNTICATGLFGQFNHSIDFQNETNVSILIAPNGCGKTTIFNFINFILNPKIKTLLPILKVPFKSFSCGLSNGKTLELLHDPIPPQKNEEQDPLWDWSFTISIRPGNHVFSFFKNRKDSKSMPESIRLFEEDDIAFILFCQEHPEVECEERFWTWSKRSYATACQAYQQFLVRHGCQVPISFIAANRLNPLNSAVVLSPRYSRIRYDFPPEVALSRTRELIDVLQKAQTEAAQLIKSALDDYGRRIAEAKNKLPSMYLNAEKDSIGFEDFKERWNLYHSELAKFHKCGLLDSSDIVIKLQDLQQAFQRKRDFLIVYLKAFEDTLHPLQGIYAKIKLFSDIFAKRNEITRKTVHFSPNGIEVRINSKTLDIHCLSSGEKNDFIMFFQLIFGVEPSSVVLIDEPEISLHIEWQQDYIDRLISICAMNGIQAIVATHSPNIVTSHLDLCAHQELANEES